MVCVYCGGKTHVVNSRSLKRTNGVWRRRNCITCGATVSTEESVIEERTLRVDRGGYLEPFTRDRVFLSVFDSLRHRKQALSDATSLTDTVISSVYVQAERGVIKPVEIIDITHGVLKRFDRAASVYYQAHHPSKPSI